MPLQPTLNINTGALVPAVEQGTAHGFLAAGGTNPVTVVGTNYGDMMLCRNGTLPTGFATTKPVTHNFPTQCSQLTSTHLGVRLVQYFGRKHTAHRQTTSLCKGRN